MRRLALGGGSLVKICAVVVAAGVLWALLASADSGPRATAVVRPAKSGAADAGRAAQGDVPVVAAFVENRTVPIYLTGLGSVQALNTVTLTFRVDGQLTELPFTEGQDVRKGDVLAQIDPRPFEAQLRQMQAQQRSNQAKLVAARADFDRASELQRTQAATRQQFDSRRAEVEQLEAAMEATQAEIDKAKLQLEYATIRSPIDGRIGLRQVDAGNMILAADRKAIVTVTQLQPITVVFSLPQEDLGAVATQMAKGRRLKVSVRGRNDKDELDTGVLATIDNQIDQKTGTFRLKATFANARNQLWPGQFVNVRLLLEEQPKGIVIPAPALQRGPNGAFVFVITPEETAAMRPVAVTQVQDGQALVESGVAVGECVVVDGQYKLRPGSRVAIVKTEQTTFCAGPDARRADGALDGAARPDAGGAKATQ